MSSFLTNADGPDNLVPAERDNSYIDDDSEYKYVDPKYTVTNRNIKAEELSSSGNDSFYIGYVASIIVRVSRESSNHLTQELLPFLYSSTLNLKDYETELLSLSKYEPICNNSICINLDGLNLNPFLENISLSRDQMRNTSSFMNNSVKVLKKNFLWLVGSTCLRYRNFQTQEVIQILKIISGGFTSNLDHILVANISI